MARYGGGEENFNAEKARLDAISARVSEVTAKEVQAQAAIEELGQAEERQTVVRRKAAAVRREGADLSDRAAAAAAKETANLDVNTAAIERNRAASARRAEAKAAEAAAVARAQQAAIVAPASRGPGTEIIRHPTQFGQPYYGEAQAIPGIAGFPRTQYPREVGTAQRPGTSTRQSAGYVEEQARLGNLTNAHQGWLASLSKEERLYAERIAAEAELSKGKLASTISRDTGLLQREGASLGSVSQAMYRHGALTQEFLVAAGRGEVTLRELGSQALITAGKFAGWTAAAAGVFGLAAAIGNVAKGAIDAQSGVEGLARFLPNLDRAGAAQGFESLSRQNNVPIADVSLAQQGFARVFQDQRQSLIATDTALKAFQLDQISVADSTRFLTAITQEFSLKADRLPLLFDQISAAQRRMGARVSELLPAIARSSAAVRNAGGDLNELVALAATAQVASGQTGNVVGTAFTRAASNFSRNPANRDIIKSFGVDTQHGFTELLISAVKKSQDLSGDQRNTLAKAIGGPQYGGRIFQTLLGQQERLNKALGDTSPEKAKGSAEEEMAHKLAQADQQIKALGLSLQQLGAALGRAGAFDFAGLLLHGLNDVLRIAVHAVDIFDKLPGPLREAAVIAAELAVTMRVLQRFGVTRGLEGGALGAFSGSTRYDATRIQRGLRDTRSGAFDQQERAAQTAFNTRAAASRAAIVAEEEKANLARAEAAAATGGAAAKEAAVSAQARFVGAQQTATSLSVRAAASAEEARVASLLAAEADAAYSEARKLSAAELVTSARARGLYAPRETAVPSTKGVEVFGAPGAVERDAASAERTASLARRSRSVQYALANAYVATGNRIGLLNDGNARLGRAGQAIDRAAITGINAAGAASTAVGKAATGIRGLGSRLGGFIGGLGPLNLALIAFPVLDILGNKLEEAQKVTEKQAADVFSPTRSQAQLQAHRARIEQLAKAPGGQTFGEAARGVLENLNPVNLFSNVTGIGGYQSPYQRRVSQVTNPAIDEVKNQNEILRLQEHARRISAPIPLQTYDTLSKSVDEDAKLRREGLISQQEFDSRLAQHAIEAGHLLDGNRKNVQTVRRAIANAQRGQGGELAFSQALSLLDDKGLQQQSQAINASLSDFGGTRRGFEQLRAVYADAIRRYGGSTDPSKILLLSQARSQFYSGIEQTAQADLQYALASSHSEQERNQAYQDASRVYTSNTLTPARDGLNRARAALAAARRRASTARNAYRDVTTLPSIDNPRSAFTDAIGTIGVSNELPLSATDLRQAAEQQAQEVGRFRASVAKFRKEYEAAKRKYRQIAAALRDAAYGDRETGRQIDLGLAQSQTGSALDQATNAIESARAQVQDAANTYGTKDRHYRQALTALNNAQDQQAQAILNNVQADNALLLARAGSDPRAQANAAVQAAQNTLNALQSQKKQDPVAIKNAQAGLIQAQNQVSQAYTDYAKQLLAAESELRKARAGNDAIAVAREAQRAARTALSNASNRLERVQAMTELIRATNDLESAIRDRELARLDFLQSQTTDPVKQAEIDVQKAQAGIKGTHGADRYKALADYNRAQQALRDQVLSSKESDIDFEKDMGKITIQDAIDRYSNLLKIRSLTKQQRRDIQLKIHQLQQESEAEATGFDLDVGSLKLPTIYDIRKGYEPIRKAVKQEHDERVRQRRELDHMEIGDALTITRNRRGTVHNDVRSNVQHHHTTEAKIAATIIVNVGAKGDEGKVYTAIDKALGTHLRARMRSKGQRR